MHDQGEGRRRVAADHQRQRLGWQTCVLVCMQVFSRQGAEVDHAAVGQHRLAGRRSEAGAQGRLASASGANCIEHPEGFPGHRVTHLHALLLNPGRQLKLRRETAPLHRHAGLHRDDPVLRSPDQVRGRFGGRLPDPGNQPDIDRLAIEHGIANTHLIAAAFGKVKAFSGRGHRPVEQAHVDGLRTVQGQAELALTEVALRCGIGPYRPVHQPVIEHRLAQVELAVVGGRRGQWRESAQCQRREGQQQIARQVHEVILKGLGTWRGRFRSTRWCRRRRAVRSAVRSAPAPAR